jgi:hypothetical protein
MSILALTQEDRDGCCELTLERHNALLNDHVWLKISNALNVKVEAVRLRIVVEGLIRVCGGFPGGIFRDRPIKVGVRR